MSAQQARLDIATILDGVLPTAWHTSTETDPEKHTGLIHVGHAATIVPKNYKAFTVELPITLWVNEADANVGVTQLYDLLDPWNDRSVWEMLKGTVDVPKSSRQLQFGEITVGNVGRRDDAQTGFLAADVTVVVKLVVLSGS